MAVDAQIDPSDLPAPLDPVVSDKVDYSRTNRLISGKTWKEIPHVCYLGNATLSLLIIIASDYCNTADSQADYTLAESKSTRNN